MTSGISTLSTGLNKSDEFIKEHAVHIHARALTFRNGQVLHLNKDSAIPAVLDQSYTRYLRCQNITYLQNYDIYHSSITLRVITASHTISTTTVNATDLNEKGIVQATNEALFRITTRIYLLETTPHNNYNGMTIFIDSSILSFQINYEGAWLLGILSTYTHDQQHTLYTLYDDNINYSNNIQLQSSTRLSKTFYPLHNGGIHKLVVSEDNLATSQYINGHKTATIAEMNIAPTFKSKRGGKPMRWNCNEVIRYTLLPHPLEPRGSIVEEIHTANNDDDVEMTVVLPSTISYLLCNEFIYEGIVTPIVITKPTPIVADAKVVRATTNVTDSNQVGEIQLDLHGLAIYSNKWLLRVNSNGSTCRAPPPSPNSLYVNHRIMFTFRDVNGHTVQVGTDTLSYVQNRLSIHDWANNVEHQTNDAQYFLSFDLTDARLKDARYLCLRHYYHIWGNPSDKGPINVTLRLFTLDETDVDRDFIKRKFPTRSAVIIPDASVRGDQPMSNENNRGLSYPSYPSTLAFLSPRSKTFDERESPWLECTTSNKISSLRLHVQDEYGQYIKSTSVTNAPFYINIAFADVPREVNA